MASSDITYYNRYTKQLEKENVFGGAFLHFVYKTRLGKLILPLIAKNPFFSALMGLWMRSSISKGSVESFIQDFKLDINEFLIPPQKFTSFNEFFIRKLKPEARPIADSGFIFPADGRHLAYQDISQINGIFVKGQKLNLKELLGSEKEAAEYSRGSVLFSRLCPVDYHRFHFPIECMPSKTQLLNGFLYSVNPIALRENIRIFGQNRRSKTYLKVKNATLIMLEIGATSMGSIIQTFVPNTPVSKGQEKGFFQFGGSTTILVFPPNFIQFDQELLHYSQQNIETYARIGDRCGNVLEI